MPLQSASEFYRAGQQRKLLAIAAVRREWNKLPDPSAWNERTLSRIVALVSAAQIGAAEDADRYVPNALREQGISTSPSGVTDSAGFAGIAYGFQQGDAFDGYPLEMVVNLAPGLAASRGTTVLEQMAAGQAFLDMMTHWQIAEASSAAVQANITWRNQMGWLRVVSPPCCKDCAVQAGKWFAHNEGFKRHPHCDCYHVPAPRNANAVELAPTPPLDQISGLNRAEQQAIRDGADLDQVVNAGRGRGAGGNLTLEGTTRRGWASYVRREIDTQRGMTTAETVTRARGGKRNVTRTRRRMTPKAIYRVSATREEAIRRLVENGYMVGDLTKLARLVS